MNGWRIYYGDGSTITGTSRQDWLAAPARGVAGLLTPSERVGRFIETDDFYLWPSWQPVPIGADAWGVMDYLLTEGVLLPEQSLLALSFDELVDAGVKLGRSLPDAEWQALHRRMAEDPDFPHKSARDPRER